MPEPNQYRFLIKSAENGIIELAWSQEQDHHPVAVGTVQITANAPAHEPLAQAAQAYLTEWQRLTGRTL